MLKTEIEKMSYSLGLNFGLSIIPMPRKLDKQKVIQGLADVFEGACPAISEEEYATCLRSFQKEMESAKQEAEAKTAQRNADEQKAFMGRNKKADGVMETASGLQYLVISEGSGATPKMDDRVRAHYTGSLLDGTIFDSTATPNKPAILNLKQVILGWAEALMLMKVGSKYRLFIPSELAYGDRSVGGISPGAMLIFDVELLEIL